MIVDYVKYHVFFFFTNAVYWALLFSVILSFFSF